LVRGRARNLDLLELQNFRAAERAYTRRFKII
jgi:hypothetical protein